MLNFLLKLAVWLHNVSYKIITKLAIKENGGVHPKHRIINYHQFFVDQVKGTEVVLDIGCGRGEVAFDVAEKAERVVGVDISPKGITCARRQFKRENLEFLLGDVMHHSFNRRFDKIILSNVLEHIQDRVSFLKKLHDISDVILLRVPMLTRDWLTLYKKEHNLEYRLDPTHFIEYSLDVLREELAVSGWRVERYLVNFGEFWGVIKKL